MRQNEYCLHTTHGRFWGSTARKAYRLFLAENPNLDADDAESIRIAFNQAWRDLKTGRRAGCAYKGYGVREIRLERVRLP